MFVFTFDRTLFKFNAEGPEFDVLLKLAPTIGKRYLTYSHREYYFPFVVLVSFCDLIQPPRSRPISLSLSEIN